MFITLFYQILIFNSCISGIVSHNAYFSYQKCIVKGECHRNGRDISFPQTNTSFRNRSNPEHHQKDKTTDEFLKSPLEDLPIDMIKDIPVADALHLIDLGLVKRGLSGWVNGSYNFRSKFFAPQINEISVWLRYTHVFPVKYIVPLKAWIALHSGKVQNSVYFCYI